MARKDIRRVSLYWVHTSDLHGSMFMHDDLKNVPTNGGASAVYGVVESCRRKFPGQIICTDGGDCLQGQPISYYYNYVHPDRPNVVTCMMNDIGYDAAVIGNHDIETGHAIYDRWIAESTHPILCANMIDNATGQPYLKPYTVIERQGVRIAVLGLVTPTIDHWLPESLWSGVHFEEMVQSARKWVARIRQEVNPHLIVGLFHSGYDGGIESVHGLENSTKTVAEQVPGFDLILYGHDHKHAVYNCMCTDGTRVIAAAPSCNGSRMVFVKMHLVLSEDKVLKKSFRATTPFLSGTIHPDTILQETEYAPMRNEALAWLDEEIGLLDVDMSEKEAYFGPCPFMNLIHRLQLEYTGADISLAAPLSFDTIIHVGPIRIRDMFNLYRYENFLYTLKLTGKEIKDLLELSYDRWTQRMTSADDHIIRLMPLPNGSKRLGFEHLAFNFVTAAGIHYTVDVTKPFGEKVRITTLDKGAGKPFSMDAEYTVAVNSYHGSGGGELLTLGAGIPKTQLPQRIIESTKQDVRTIFIQRIRQIGHVCPPVKGNWTFVPTDWTTDALKRDKIILFGH